MQTDHCDENRYELELIECDHCGIEFSEEETLKRHLQINHSVTHGLKCGQCDNEFKDNDEKIRHICENTMDTDIDQDNYD